MTLFAYLGSSAAFSAGSALASSTIRLGDINGFAQTANQGEAAFTNLTVDDPAGALSFIGLRPFWVEETACNPSRVWTGYVTSRSYQRDPGRSQIVGADRTTILTLVDINAILQLRVIAFNDGIRPAERDIDRVAWILGTSYLPVYDNGQIAASTSITMDAADYRGQYPIDVLNDCANASGRNYFVYWDSSQAAGHELSLYYHLLGFTTGFTSSLQLSNDSTAIDNVTTFGASAVLTRDPQDVYSSVWLPYDGGHVYHTRASTATAFIARHAVAPANKTKNRTTAGKRAEAFLDAAAAEHDEIDCTVRLPASKVNLIDIGRAVSVHFTHLPGYDSGYTSLQVVARQVNQTVENPNYYDVDLHLANPKPSGGASGGGSGAPFVQQCEETTFSITLNEDDGTFFSSWGNDGGTTWLDNLSDGDTFDVAWTFTNGIADDLGHLEYSRRIFFCDTDPTPSDFNPSVVSWLPQADDGGIFGDDLEPQVGTAGFTLTATGTWTFDLTSATLNGWVPGNTIWFYAHGGWSPGTGSGGSATLTLTPSGGSTDGCSTPLIGQTVPPENAGTGNDTTTTYYTNYPYQPGSLHVTVNGIAWVATETDPTTGAFTLPVAPPTGAVVNVEYQAASPDTTGAGNSTATPPTGGLPSFPYTNHVGDLMVSDGSNHWRTFSGGSNTQVLTRDMTELLGVKWADSSGGGGGVSGITSNGSNQVTGVANLVAGVNIALGVSGQDITITNTGSSGGGGGGGGGSTGVPVIIQAKEASNAISSFTLDQTPSNSTLALLVDGYSTGTSTAISSTNTTWTKVKSWTSGGGAYLDLWIGQVSGSGGTTVTVTHPNAFCSITCLEIVDTVTPALGVSATVSNANPGGYHSILASSASGNGSLIVFCAAPQDTSSGHGATLFPSIPTVGLAAAKLSMVVGYGTGNPLYLTYASPSNNDNSLAIVEVT